MVASQRIPTTDVGKMIKAAKEALHAPLEAVAPPEPARVWDGHATDRPGRNAMLLQLLALQALMLVRTVG